jgi:hypothetical protein
VYRTEHYDYNNIKLNGNIEIHGHNPCRADTIYSILTNRDSSFFQSIIYNRSGIICGRCLKERSSATTICKLFGGKEMEFTRKEFIFEDIEKAFEFTECGCLCWY